MENELTRYFQAGELPDYVVAKRKRCERRLALNLDPTETACHSCDFFRETILSQLDGICYRLVGLKKIETAQVPEVDLFSSCANWKKARPETLARNQRVALNGGE